MKITIADIPGYFETDFSDQLYIDSSKHRLIGNGQDIVVIQTSEKHKVKNDETYSNRKVQSIFYDKYILSFYVTESTNVDLLYVANNVTVTLDNGEIHKAKLTEAPLYENVQNSSFKKVTINYINTYSKSTVNHLYVTDLTNGIASFKSGLTTIYSPVYCKFDVSDYERTENSDNSITLVSSDNAFRVIRFYAYISDDLIETVKRGLSAAYLSSMNVVFNGTTYQALEVPEIEVNDNEYEGIKELIVTLRYEQILNYPYIETSLVDITISSDPTTLRFSYTDSTVLSSLITTNGTNGWNILSVSDSWINAYKLGDSVYVSVSNTTGDRSGSVVVASVDDITKTATISIQQIETDISADPTSLMFALIDTSTKISAITTSDPSGWEIKSKSGAWITATKNGDDLEIQVLNTETARTGSVTVSIVDDDTKTAIVYIYQGIAI